MTYMTETISYLGEVKHIIPCGDTLSSIGNFLILRGDMYIPPEEFDDWELVAAIRETLEKVCPVGLKDMLDTANGLITEIPGLITEIPEEGHEFFDPYPTWDRVDGFQRLDFSLVFEILGIPYYHGWIVDLENPGEKTCHDLTGESVVERLMMRRRCTITEKGSQLLLERVKEDEICLLFYHDRFIPVTKHGNQLLMLGVNFSFDYDGLIVWRTFDGDNLGETFTRLNRRVEKDWEDFVI